MKKLQIAREEHGFKNVLTQDGRIMYWDAVSELNYIITEVCSHDTLQCLKRKEKIV